MGSQSALSSRPHQYSCISVRLSSAIFFALYHHNNIMNPCHSNTIFVPSAQPARSLPDGLSMVVNLRGDRSPPYRVPETTEYLPLFVRGGPNAWASAGFIDMILRRIGNPGGRVLIHCQHGKNRTGMVWCALAIRDGHSHTVKEALEAFAVLRPGGVERPWVVRALRNWFRKSRYLKKEQHGKHRTGIFHHRGAQSTGQSKNPVAPEIGRTI